MTIGTDQSPFERYRVRAASLTIWSKAGWMKSANWISAIGMRPFKAAPIATPTMADSASGVSSTRASPNRAYRPADVLAHAEPPVVAFHPLADGGAPRLDQPYFRHITIVQPHGPQGYTAIGA